MTAVVALVVLAFFAVAYRTYAKWIESKVYGIEAGEAFETPAHELRDEHDYVPTKKHILFGHHFTSVAGAAPIIGPCVAAYYGWLPALCWVVIGTIFMGAVHDFGALVASAREKGRSIADIAANTLSSRARIMFMCFILVLVWLVLAVFAMAIAGLFVALPSSVLPVNIEIIIAMVVGWLIYKKGADALVPSLVALALLYLFVWVGTEVPLDITAMGLSAQAANQTWIILLFVYCGIASLLPVWFLLQPRDFINSHQLIVGLALLFAGVFIAHPEFDAPALREIGPGDPPIFPMLFVTIACGAISGFHGLVSSGTTSKQLDKMADARAIGYGSMLGEGTLALFSTLAAVAGVSLVGACTLPGQGEVSDLSWGVYYDTWAHAGANKATAFVLGGGAFLEAIGLPTGLARTLMAVLVISFAATSLDTATRIQRLILAELGRATKIKPLENRYIATFLALAPAALLTFWEVPDPVTGAAKQAGWVLWPIFGASNQMLAALTLMVIALYFWQQKRPVLPLIIPMAFVMVITLVAMVDKLRGFFEEGNLPMTAVATVFVALILWMLVEGALAFREKARS